MHALPVDLIKLHAHVDQANGGTNLHAQAALLDALHAEQLLDALHAMLENSSTLKPLE